MQVIRNDKILYVDIDDTLVIWSETGHSYKPHKKHIDYIKRFHMRGQAVVAWSAGGFEWCERIIKELGLEPYITLVVSKPAWWMDDLKADQVLFEVNRIYLKDYEENENSNNPVDTE